MLIVAEPTLRNPFSLVRKPFMARVYARRFESGNSVAQGALAGHSFLRRAIQRLFLFFWHVYPLSRTGAFRFVNHNTREAAHADRIIPFDSSNTQFHALYFERYKYGYEPEVANFFDLVLGEKDVFYDVGANWGYFSLFVASKPGWRGRVYAFEPLSRAFLDLGRIVKAAGLGEVVSLYRVALASQNGKGYMHMPDGLHSGLAELKTVSAEGGLPDDGSAVDIVSLDELMAREMCLPPAAMKIDAEGSEFSILAGAEKTIRAHHPVIVFESWSSSRDPERSAESFRWLSERGYSCFALSWQLEDGTLVADNRAVFRRCEQGEKVKLALQSFLPEERTLFQTKINCAAVYAGDLDGLLKRNQALHVVKK